MRRREGIENNLPSLFPIQASPMPVLMDARFQERWHADLHQEQQVVVSQVLLHPP
jgi:hypothetical protein